MIFLIQGSKFSNPAALLDCIAEMCRVQSTNTLIIRNRNGISIHRQDYGHILSVLNDSLHQNPSMCHLNIDPLIQTCFKLEELHKDHLNIRRTLNSISHLHLVLSTCLIALVVVAVNITIKSKNVDTVKPALVTTCIQRPPLFKDHLVVSQLWLYHAFAFHNYVTVVLREFYEYGTGTLF